MKKKTLKKVLCALTACLWFCFSAMTTIAAEKVTPSTTEYTVELYKSGAFIGNDKALDVTNGEAFFLTYTVDSVKRDTTTQSGLIATENCESPYPYVDGIMQFTNLESLLLKPGYTYFYKIQVTEFGFEYVVICSNKEEEGYVTGFTQQVGEIKENMKYCGVWIAGGEDSEIAAKLTHVRCYDKNGNDLGLTVKNGTVIDKTFRENSSTRHTYEFSLDNQQSLAISNSKYTKAETIYFEYEISDVKKNEVEQNGFITTNSPATAYPYDGGNGYMKWQNYPNEPGGVLTVPGAKYLIRFVKTSKGVEITARYTLKGGDTYIEFPLEVGKYDADTGYCSLWLAGKGCTAKFTNVKCYDGDGNNLGIQLNDKSIEVIHYGGLEDYSVCEGAYYCEELDTMITLKADCSVNVQNYSKKTQDTGKYTVDDLKLSMEVNGKKSTYEYAYIHMVDEEGNIYVRMKEYQVRFVSGEETQVQVASMENGYIIAEPEDPIIEGNTFLGWCLRDGTEYNFETVVKESATVYAKWQDGDGNVYLAIDDVAIEGGVDMSFVIVIISCVLLAVITVVGCIWFGKKGRGHEAE